MYTEVTRIRKPDPHVHEGDPNSVHTEVAKTAVWGSDICADLSGFWRARRALLCASPDHPSRVDSSIDLPSKKNQKSEFKKTSGIPSPPPPPPPQELLDTKLKGGKRLQMCFAPGSRYQSKLASVKLLCYMTYGSTRSTQPARIEAGVQELR